MQNLLGLHVGSILLQLPLSDSANSRALSQIIQSLKFYFIVSKKGSEDLEEITETCVNMKETHCWWNLNFLCSFMLKDPAQAGGPGKLAWA